MISMGYNHVDMAACKERGIMMSTASGGLEQAMFGPQAQSMRWNFKVRL